MRIFGGDQMKALCERFSVDENTPIEAKIITNQIRNAQASVEDRNFSIRKHVLGYDDVMNVQRKIIYEQRNVVLDGMDVHEQIKAMMHDVVATIVHKYVYYKVYHVEWDYENFNKELENNVLNDGTNLLSPDYVVNFETEEEITNDVTKVAIDQYEEKIKQVQEEFGIDFARFERDCLLRNVDINWMEHIDNMDHLKQGISLVAYAHQDPVQVYSREGYEMFEAMNQKIQEDVVRILTKAKIEKKVEVRRSAKLDELKTNDVKNKPMTSKKIGRNEPCPCGSGKKYKDCCGR